jgi:homospermidine synthase
MPRADRRGAAQCEERERHGNAGKRGVAGILWSLDNPRRGLCFPEDLPRDEILRHAAPDLGRLVSTPVDWTPLDNFHVHFGDRPRAQPDRGVPWQYRNFAFQP